MATGTSILLIAVGAILAFAVDAEVGGLDLDAVGVILMIAGAIGLLVSLFWADRLGTSRRRTVVREEPAGRVVEDRTY